MGVVDSGIYSDGAGNNHPDLAGNFKQHLSLFPIRLDNFQPDSQDFFFPGSGHGTHVAGLIAAKPNNGIGIAGACWNCNLVVTRGGQSSSNAFSVTSGGIESQYQFAIDQGIQVLNRSGAENPTIPITSNCLLGGTIDPICPWIQKMRERDVLFVVSAGNNNFNGAGFPANQPSVISVGGVDAEGKRWNPYTSAITPPNGPSICFDTSDPDNSSECGSNYSATFSTFAPAVKVISTFANSKTWVAGRCDDQGFAAALGYDFCTGTSMSAPLISGIAALARSANPLLDFQSFRSALGESNSIPPGAGDDVYPGVANAALVVARALGALPGGSSSLCNAQNDCRLLNNRLTPMFHLTYTNPANESTTVTCTDRPGIGAKTYPRPRAASPAPGAQLFTTRPQVAVAAVMNELYVDGYELWAPGGVPLPCAPPLSWAATAVADILVPQAPGYEALEFEVLRTTQQAIDLTNARASFYLFTTERNVMSIPVKPLYRLSFDSPWPSAVDDQQITEVCAGMGRDFVYATNLANTAIAAMLNTDQCADAAGVQSYRVDGIEGYVLTGSPGSLANNAGLRKLHLRGPSGAAPADRDWAILTEDQVNSASLRPAVLNNHGYAMPNGESDLGYAFINVDNDQDRLINGTEYLIGTDRNAVDSDMDSLEDGDEFSPFGLSTSNPRISNAEMIFASGFEGN